MTKNFLAVFIATPESLERSGWAQLSESQRKEKERVGITAWGQWVQAHAPNLIEVGSPLGKTKRTGNDGVSDTRNHLTAYTVVKADSHEDAARLFERHPHFTLFPGDCVEIMECLPIPSV